MGFPVVCVCGTRFALGLLRCPRCNTVSAQFAKSVQEDQVARITVAAGPTDVRALPGEVGYIEPEGTRPQAVTVQDGPAGIATGSGMTVPAPPAAEESVKAISVPTDGSAAVGVVANAPADGGPPGVPVVQLARTGYGSMTVLQLRDAARERGLPVGGSKADLVARLAAAGTSVEGGAPVELVSAP